MDQLLLLGDHVWVVAGGPIGEVVELDLHPVHLYQLALVKFYWGKSYWHESSKLVRTHSPVSK